MYFPQGPSQYPSGIVVSLRTGFGPRLERVASMLEPDVLDEHGIEPYTKHSRHEPGDEDHQRRLLLQSP